MAGSVRYPTLFQINTRVWLERRSREAGKRITLAEIDDATLDSFALAVERLANRRRRSRRLTQ